MREGGESFTDHWDSLLGKKPIMTVQPVFLVW